MPRALESLAISPTGFVFDPRSGATFSLNPTALALIAGIQASLDLTGLVEKLETEFEVADADLRRDVLEFTRLLRDEGLLSADFELA